MTRNTGSVANPDAAWLRLYVAVAALPLVLTACGGGGGGSPTPSPSPSPSSATITVTPSNTAITAPGGGAVTLTAAVTGSTATPTWTLSGPGTLSAASGTTITYTPPTTTDFATGIPVIVSASVSGATTNNTTLTLTTAADGLTWGNVTATSIGTLQSVDYFNSHFVAVSDAGNALVSADAATWTSEPVLASSTSSDHFNAYAVAHLGSTLVAVGARSPSPYTTSTGAAAYSTDGLSWTQATLTNVDAPIRALLVGDHLVGVGDGGNIYSSTNGHSWNLVATIPGSVTFNGGTYATVSGASRYVVVGNAGALAVSNDGVQWTSTTLPVSVNLRAIAWTGSRFVIVGDNGTIYTSPNGTTIDNNPTSAITGTLRSVAVSSTGEVVVVGDAGIESSPDGLSWHARDPAGAAALFDVSYLNSEFVAVGAASAIKTSTH
jgi:hypothetical protein